VPCAEKAPELVAVLDCQVNVDESCIRMPVYLTRWLLSTGRQAMRLVGSPVRFMFNVTRPRAYRSQIRTGARGDSKCLKWSNSLP
jgi:hypothetical protein